MASKTRIYFYVIAITLSVGAGLFCAKGYVGRMITDHVNCGVQKELGHLPLHPDQEDKITNIALEMGITEPINIRKMSQKAMAAFGYHNAFACFPLLFNCIPTYGTPYLFVSEGFWEDLSPEEQRFLIGHEMVHIKERHTLYLNLLLYLLFLLLTALAYFIVKKIQKLVMGISCKKYIVWSAVAVNVIICVVLPDLIAYAYRKHIEKVADCQSMQLLDAYEGCTKIIDRWRKEFNLPAHNSYYGLFSDHPSCHERKLYCQEMQSNKQHNNERIIT